MHHKTQITNLDIGVKLPLQYNRDANLENSITAQNCSPLAPILNMNELAQYLQVSKATAYCLVKQKDFPAFRVGKSIRINARSLGAWIQSRSLGTEE
ncbi:helix-turn-helix domain-containing protein [Huintestinicola sp.]